MLRLSLYGGFFLTNSFGTDVPIKSRKAKALLAYLALKQGEMSNREEIMALLWSDRQEAQARASLRQVLTGLRKDLGDGPLLVDADTIALNPDQIMLDPSKDGEFMAGFRLADPAFEEWLRDERLRTEDKPFAIEPVNPEALDKYTLAVPPFVNLSGDPDQDYFSDGISEDIITELSCFPDFIGFRR